jgi:hypothetical protein
MGLPNGLERHRALAYPQSAKSMSTSGT